MIGPLTDPPPTAATPPTPSTSSARRCPATASATSRREPGWGVERIAGAWAELMARLGYERYGAPGRRLGLERHRAPRPAGPRARRRHPPHAAARAARPGDVRRPHRARARGARRPRAAAQRDSGYSAQQATRPQTLGYGLVDSPVGAVRVDRGEVLGVDRLRRHPRRARTDELLDNVMLYWLPGPARRRRACTGRASPAWTRDLHAARRRRRRRARRAARSSRARSRARRGAGPSGASPTSATGTSSTAAGTSPPSSSPSCSSTRCARSSGWCAERRHGVVVARVARAAVAWVDERLAAAGLDAPGEVEQPRVRPWATVLRIPVATARSGSRPPGPAPRSRSCSTRCSRAPCPDRVLTPIAADAARGWILLPDGGPTLGEREGGPRERRAGAVRPAPARARAARRGDARARRPRHAAGRDARALRRGAGGRERGRRGDAAPDRRDEGTVRGWCERLAASPLPPSLDHNDLHERNVLVGEDGGVRYYDWGDSVVAHPFAAMLCRSAWCGGGAATPGSCAPATPTSTCSPTARRGPSSPRRSSSPARVAKIARALTWHRALQAAREQGEAVDPDWASRAAGDARDGARRGHWEDDRGDPRPRPALRRRGREAIEFYKAAFGAVEDYRVGGTDESRWSPSCRSATRRSGSPTSRPSTATSAPRRSAAATVRMLLVVEDPDAAIDRAVAPAPRWWPRRATSTVAPGRIADPFGHDWEIGKPLIPWPPS